MSHSAQLETLDETPRSNGWKRPCRVLVVEDHVDSATMLATFLSFKGYLVRIAYNADMALEIAHEFRPEVCLCDIGLPKTSGYELAPRLLSQLPEILLIAVTGWVREQDRERCQDAGFSHHVFKPVELEALLRLIRNRLSAGRA